jgi:Winged helix DNA-binding domain
MRLRAQGLLPGDGFGSVAEAARSCLTIQAQDPPAAALAARARVEGLTLESARAQAAGGEVCRAWLMRNTIHMFATDDLRWMRPLLAERPMPTARRRFGQMGLEEDEVQRYLDLLRDRLEQGPLPRAEARELLIDAGLGPGEGNERFYWLFHVAAVQGILVVGPALDQKQRFIAAPADEPLEREEGYARLARRFLQAYGPATPRDLAYWGKVTITESRAGFEAADPVEVATPRGPMWALPATLEASPDPGAPVVRLLPVWENYLLGYEDRSLAVPEPHDRVPGAGKPAATMDGLAFGHWRIDRGNESIEIVVEPFGPVPRAARQGLKAEAEDVGRFLGADAGLRIERA